MLWVCLGGAAQLIVVSAVWAWLPSFLNRFLASHRTRRRLKPRWSLCGAAGSVIWGWVVGRAGAKRPRYKLHAMGALCIVAMLVLMWAFGHMAPAPSQFWLIALGGFVMTCTVGPVVAVVIDVVHPGVRATGASVLALFQNLFGLAAGPFIRRVIGRLRSRDGTHCDPGVRPAGRILFHSLRVPARADIHQVEDVHVEVDRSGSVAQPA